MKTIQEILEDRRRKNEIDLESRRAEVEKKAPDIIKLENDIKRKNIERIQALLEKKDTDILTAQVEKLSKMKFSLLEENKFPVDYLEMKYHCDICKDTGAVGTKRCKCTEALKVEKLYENSELKGSIEYENFEKFDLSKFRKSRQEGELISPYENMKDLRDEMLEYSENFTRDSVNLYLFGPVGTGKTFMINCIAKKLMDDGFSLVYLSEADLVNLVLEHRFAYSQYKQGLQEKLDYLYNADMLVIDDLGANTPNENTKSALFEVINKRLVKRLPIIISSNLETEQLRSVYDTRLYSRITGLFYPKYFYGNDLRMS